MLALVQDTGQNHHLSRELSQERLPNQTSEPALFYILTYKLMCTPINANSSFLSCFLTFFLKLFLKQFIAPKPMAYPIQLKCFQYFQYSRLPVCNFGLPSYAQLLSLLAVCDVSLPTTKHTKYWLRKTTRAVTVDKT